MVVDFGYPILLYRGIMKGIIRGHHIGQFRRTIMTQLITEEDGLVTICDSCNEPTELITWKDSEEVCYGHGQISTEWFECEGSQCCHSGTTEWPIGYWAEEYPKIALEFGYITKKEYNQIMGEIK